MRQGLGLQLRPGRDRRPENDHAAEDDDNRQNTKSAFSFGRITPPKTEQRHSVYAECRRWKNANLTKTRR